MKISTGSRDGFTLIEVILAVAILSLGLLSVVRILPLGIQAQQRAEHLTLAYLLAEEKMEEIKAGGYESLIDGNARPRQEYGSREGKSGDQEGHGWHLIWRDTDLPNLVKVQVRILLWESRSLDENREGEPGKEPCLVELVTYLAARSLDAN